MSTNTDIIKDDDIKEIFVATFWVWRYPSFESLQTKTRGSIRHLSFLNFDLDIINITNCLEGTVEPHVFLVTCCFLWLYRVISKIFHSLLFIHRVHLRIRSHRFTIVTGVQILRLHQTFLHLNALERLFENNEFMLCLLEVSKICTLESFLSGWNSLASL